MNDRKKMQKALYEYCKSDEFKQAISIELKAILNKRQIERSMIAQKIQDKKPLTPVTFKSSPLDKITSDLVFTEFWKVLNKKSELPRAQRDIIYVIGIKCLQNKFGNNGQLRG